jgi:hypothetical protein
MAAPPAAPAQALPGGAAKAPARTTLRRYRADAVILFLGFPIFKRAGVGGGQGSIEETGEGAELRRTLFFAGGSDPKRAHGLERLGLIREVVLGPAPAPTEVSYFGVLSSSPEESLDHARKAIAGPQSGRKTFSAVNGRNTIGHSRAAVTHFDYAAGALWSDQGLIDAAQSQFRAAAKWRETSWPNSPGHAPPTFLLQMTTLLQQRAKRLSGIYVYNEQEYLLELEMSQQGKPPERVWAVRGKIRNQRTGHQTPFRLWVEDAPGAVVPLRIEFQPRSFLRLTLEALPA